MAYISVTNLFRNNTKMSSVRINVNFADITDGLSDGTKDIYVDDLTASENLNIDNANIAGNIDVDGTGVINGLLTITGTLTITEACNIKRVGFKAAEVINAAAKTITPTQCYIFVDSAVNEIDEIVDTNFVEGSILYLMKIAGSTDLTIKNNVNNIQCGIDHVLYNNSIIEFIYDGSNWLKVEYKKNDG